MVQPTDLTGFAFASRLGPRELETVASLSRAVSIDTGEHIIEEGHEADRCWLIRSGQVTLQTRLPNGRSGVVQTLGAGDLLGWSWIIAPYRWRFDGVASEPVTALEIDAVQLRRLAEADPELGFGLLLGVVESLADRLHAARARLIDLYGGPRAR